METIEKGGLTLTVDYDYHTVAGYDFLMGDIEDAGIDLSNHRDYAGNAITEAAPVDVPEFLYWYQEKYHNGNTEPFDKDANWEFLQFDKNYHWATVYMYDHSRRTINTTGFNDPWDSGKAGIAFIKKTAFAESNMYGVKKSWPADKREEAAQKYLSSCVNELDNYFRGEAYFYSITDEEGDQIEGCYGFWGEEKYALEEGEYMLEALLKHRAKNRMKKLKALIISKTPLHYREPLLQMAYKG